MSPSVLLALALASLQAPEGASAPLRSATAGAPGSRPQIDWQRSLEDAEALSRASGKPLLVCVNMDGEVACETFANRKYQDVLFVDLTQGFVPLIASPVRHNDADHDPRGQRIECPRFGRVTCGEHMRVEAPVYDRFFGGKRYAPRHVGVRFADGGPGTVLFDRYLDTDLRRVDEALRAQGLAADLPHAEDPVASRDAGRRAALEARYLAADAAGRRDLLVRCAESSVTQAEVLRLGLHETDPELRRLAAVALGNASETPPVDLVMRALAQDEDLARRERLAVHLVDRAASDERAANQLKVNQVLRTPPPLGIDAWAPVFEQAEDVGALEDRWVLEARLEELQALGADEDPGAPEDGERTLRVADCYLGLARWGLADGRGPGYLLQDADSFARRAQEQGGDAAHAAAVRAQVAWLEGRQGEAGDLAEAALGGLEGDGDRRAAFAVLSVLAASRSESIRSAGSDWKEAWAAEALASYRAIESHVSVTAAQWAAHVELLDQLDLDVRRDRVLNRGLERFPVAPELHALLRSTIIEQRGFEGLEAAYVEARASSGDTAGHDWFTGYALLVVAEDHRRGERWEAAQVAYERAKDYFERSASANAEYELSSVHFQAMALAGQAQAALEDGELETAVVRISDAVRLRPESVETRDGLRTTPLEVLTRIVDAVRRPSNSFLMARLARLERTAPAVWQRVN